jgi:hypothetical protein
VDAGPGKAVLTVTLSGPGTVTSTPAGLTCAGTTCSGAFDVGTKVKLAAAPGPGSFLLGWSGTCGGTDVCAPVLTGGLTVGAAFESFTGTWSGPYTFSATIQGCAFTESGTLSFTASTITGTSVPTSETISGQEDLNLPSCNETPLPNMSGTTTLTFADTKVSGTLNFNGVNGNPDLAFTLPATTITIDQVTKRPKLVGGWFTLTKQ